MLLLLCRHAQAAEHDERKYPDDTLRPLVGKGRRADPYSYYLPEKMAEWQEDPVYKFHKMMRESSKEALASLKTAASLDQLQKSAQGA